MTLKTATHRPITFMASNKLFDRLNSEADRRDCYVANVIRDALALYFAQDQLPITNIK